MKGKFFWGHLPTSLHSLRNVEYKIKWIKSQQGPELFFWHLALVSSSKRFSSQQETAIGAGIFGKQHENCMRLHLQPHLESA